MKPLPIDFQGCPVLAAAAVPSEPLERPFGSIIIYERDWGSPNHEHRFVVANLGANDLDDAWNACGNGSYDLTWSQACKEFAERVMDENIRRAWSGKD